MTLYRARGDQLKQYGYAAFALTVIPYLMMSVLNLCSNLLLADYPSIFITRSCELDEAIFAGAKVDGLVGRLQQQIPAPETHPTEERITFSSNSSAQLVAHTENHGIAILGSSSANDVLAEWNLQQTLTHEHGEEGAIQSRRPPEDVEIFVPSCRYFKTSDSKSYTKRFLAFFALYIFGPLPYAIIGALTHFHKGESTHAQCVWTMIWLAFGIFI